MKLGISNGPVTNTTVTPWGLSWDELCKTLQSPEMGLKDGSYFTVCTFSGDHRSGGNIIYPLQGFVLDGDSTIAIDTGELKITFFVKIESSIILPSTIISLF